MSAALAPMTQRVICCRCGALERVPVFARGREWPAHCGRPMLAGRSNRVRVADGLIAFARFGGALAEVEC